MDTEALLTEIFGEQPTQMQIAGEILADKLSEERPDPTSLIGIDVIPYGSDKLIVLTSDKQGKHYYYGWYFYSKKRHYNLEKLKNWVFKFNFEKEGFYFYRLKSDV